MRLHFRLRRHVLPLLTGVFPLAMVHKQAGVDGGGTVAPATAPQQHSRSRRRPTSSLLRS